MTDSPTTPNKNLPVLFLVDDPGPEVNGGKPLELLNKMVNFLGIAPYVITNLRHKEALVDAAGLEQTIANAQPLIIVSVGAAVTGLLMGSSRTISEFRGQVFKRNDRLVVPIFSPAYILKAPSQLGKLLTDLRLIRILRERVKESVK